MRIESIISENSYNNIEVHQNEIADGYLQDFRSGDDINEDSIENFSAKYDFRGRSTTITCSIAYFSDGYVLLVFLTN